MMADLRYGQPQVPAPKVSIVTTVYDRTVCLERCLRSVQRSQFLDWEQIVVSDAPGAVIEDKILTLVKNHQDRRLRYLALPTRANDWGITPAAVGWRASIGQYVCFLSDDNAFLPGHLGPLVEALDADPELGFVYSSCLYEGRVTLKTAPPTGGKIDLGQLLIRRETMRAHCGDRIPFVQHSWDWPMVKRFLEHDVKWRHVDATTFVFRLAKYPHYLAELA